MLMPRPQYTTTSSNNNSNLIDLNHSITMEQQQQHHINQLLTTAAGGTGVVGDVDALLTPLQQLAAAQQLLEPRPERNLWRTDEIMQMLKLMQKTNAIEQLNDKTIKSENVFRTIEDMMHGVGYRKKSHVQIWTKWKFLKSTYTTSRRHGVVPKMIPYEIYEVLHKMLCGSSSDCGNSMDGDSSNGGRMVISGVEGNYTNGNKNGGVEDSEDESGGFGMAHPIFGFRLGSVKQEPVDTGYETNANNDIASDKDPFEEMNTNSPGDSSTANIRFQTEIKQEAVEEEAFNVQSLEQQQQQHSPDILLTKRPVRITPIAPVATSPTPSPTPVQLAAARNPQLPPLRIAPFAKAPNSVNAIVQPALNRPPPPLSMHPVTPRPIRLTSSNMPGGTTGAVGKFILPKILPKPEPVAITDSQINMPIRLPKDITIQSRAGASVAAANPNMPRLKQVPIRKTPYSLRPDRMKDLSASMSPPPAPFMPKHYAAAPIFHPENPTTSQQRAFNTPNVPSRLQTMVVEGNRKRRLEMPPMPARAKMQRTINSTHYAKAASNFFYNHHHNNNDGDNNDYDGDHDNDDDSSMYDCASAQRASFNASTQQQYHADTSAKTPLKNTRKEQEFFESALKDLGTSLRQMQREMISDFFEKQMELARREHEFQMRQDLMIMQAFEEQTQQIMRSVKELLGVDLTKAGAQKDSTVGTKEKLNSKLRDQTKAKEEAAKQDLSNTKPALETVETLEIGKADTKTEAEETVADQATAVEDDDDAEDDDDDDEEEEEEEYRNNDMQLEYEDSEYLQDNNLEPVQQMAENEEDSDEEDDNDDDENDDNELVNDQDSSSEDENVDDPIQLVSSELVENN